MIYYTVYKITNTVNGKYYIGAHKTTDLNDSYMGSGTLLQSAISKYGKDSFQKEIIHLLDSEEEMYAKEAELVTESTAEDRGTYNLKPGGPGNFYHINKNGPYIVDSVEHSERMKKWWKDRDEKLGAESRKNEKVSKSLTGRKLSETHKENLKGKMWVKKDSESKYIRREELAHHLNEGWVKGRTMPKKCD